jgi:hypothetical protein
MSRRLLQRLNGSDRGSFNTWLNAFQGEPRIAWYPSAGCDFRDLLFLNSQYSTLSPSIEPDPAPPDLFLHTDYYPWSSSTFLDEPSIYEDSRTSVSIQTIQELPRCYIPLNSTLVHFPKGGSKTGRVFFLEIEVQSRMLGTFTRPVVYAFVENAAFCSKLIIPEHGRMSHIIHVRYGGGCGGGGNSDGAWLINVFRKVRCELFISDDHITATQGLIDKQDADEYIYELYPNLHGAEDVSQLTPIRTIPSESWSGHGDVTWNLLRPESASVGGLDGHSMAHANL